MRVIKETDYKELKVGDIICIQGSIELVTDVLDHTFYSAPIFDDPKYQESLSRSSHWVGSLNEDDYLYVFESKEEMISQISIMHDLLFSHYKCNKIEG